MSTVFVKVEEKPALKKQIYQGWEERNGERGGRKEMNDGKEGNSGNEMRQH